MNQVFVWTLSDVVGGIMLLLVALAFLVDMVYTKIRKWKNKK